ncbi:MAG TPA: amidase [Bryobacteraceae bacterium]|nr:amidase [Bryobacteraceae bacterium]
MNEILTLSGVAQAALIRDRKISARELFRLHLDRIAEVNPKINAVVEVLLETEPLPGPFSGVPFSIKDSIEVAGTVCSAGTLGYRHALKSTHDATLVARLRAAGAVPVARTNLPDLLFAFESDNLIYGRTNNPYDRSRTSGGSSGGEAALIASCGSPFGLGSDAAGSVRLPAHYCGIASLKPTSGRLARTGHVPPAGGWVEMLWQIGPMSRHVEDLCAMMPILLGADGEDFTVVPMPYEGVAVKDLRIAYFTSNGFAEPDAGTQAVVEAAGKALGAVEHRPQGVEKSYQTEMMLLGADGGDGARSFVKSAGSDRTHPLLDGWLAKLEEYRTDAPGFANYWRQLDQFRAGMYASLSQFDVILSPVSASPAVPHGTSIEEKTFKGFSYTMTHNLTGWPAAVVRCGTSSAGLPIGVQIAGAPWREDIVLTVARRLEEIFGGWQSVR